MERNKVGTELARWGLVARKQEEVVADCSVLFRSRVAGSGQKVLGSMVAP